ncbi:MAG: acetyl-CoA carboxylase carboxyl transferase subunit beta, partial [Candidatus Omnitrophica bacterium]|nr:acetyl-CoA carboxylase carboxyl transferase subunit beta [Candidatus Omnitrophota bacterium]
MPLFKKPKYTVVKVSKRKGVPDGTWLKCEGCGEMIYKKTLDENLKVCPKCNYHFIIGAYERIGMFLDNGSFEEFDKGMKPRDFLNFKGPKTYIEKIEKDTIATGMEEA